MNWKICNLLKGEDFNFPTGAYGKKNEAYRGGGVAGIWGFLASNALKSAVLVSGGNKVFNLLGKLSSSETWLESMESDGG